MFFNPYADLIIVLPVYYCPDIHRRVRELSIMQFLTGTPQELLSQDDQVLKDGCLPSSPPSIGNFIAEVRPVLKSRARMPN